MSINVFLQMLSSFFVYDLIKASNYLALSCAAPAHLLHLFFCCSLVPSLINHTLGLLYWPSVQGYEVVTPPQRVLAAPDTIARPKENLSAPNQKIIVPRAFIFAGSRS